MHDHPSIWMDMLVHDFHIHAVRSGPLVSLKYDQLESPMASELVQQCRGMVVDANRRAVLAWPYNKFWNHGEALAAPIDWTTARVQEKLDGSLMIMYKAPLTVMCDSDVNGWLVASSGHPTANGSFGDSSRRFRDAFWGHFSSLSLAEADSDATYMFELCDVPNRIVVIHERPRLVLHGARWTESGEELTPAELAEHAARIGCELVREFPISTAQDCVAAAATINPLHQEGFVVVDSWCHRVKIKSPRYVALHHLKGEATPRRTIELWQAGEVSELLVHFPEMASIIGPVVDRLEQIARRAVDEHAEAMSRSADRKGYAALAMRHQFSSVMFRLLALTEPTTDEAKAIMRRMSTSALERMVQE